MSAWFAAHFLWWKAAHLVGVIAWMMGMLYLPRLFVYHSKAEPGSELWLTLCAMERRLFYYVMTPAAALAVLAGVGMLIAVGLFNFEGFFPFLKLLLVGGLLYLQHQMMRWVGVFAAGEVPEKTVVFRLLNQGVGILVIAIVYLIVVRPF